MQIKTGAGLGGQIVKEKKKNQENYDPNDSCTLM
jgi:hypothetical protein